MSSTKLKDTTAESIVCSYPCLKLERDKNLYESRHETGDIKFLVDSHVVQAHRCILAALSPKYKAQFYGAMAEKDMITVTGVTVAAFEEFLQFFYMDQVKLTIENIEDVLSLAQQSLVEELVTECTRFLLDAIGMDKLLWGYRLAHRYDIEDLRVFCLKHIRANIKDIFKTNEFLSCDHETLCDILSLKALKCTEHDLFNGYIAWAQAKCVSDGIDASKTENLRTALGDALFKIRFSEMSAQEFATIGREYAGLLTAQASIEIFHTIILKANNAKKQESMKNWSLKCKLTKGQTVRRDTQTKQDCIGFTCDKAIQLHGFIMCSRIVDTVQVEVYINGKQYPSKMKMKTSNTKTQIKFLKPIKVKEKKSCRIFVKTTKKSSLGWLGYNVVSGTTAHDVSFQFQRDKQDGIYSITQLLFNVADDPKENQR